MYNKMKQRHGIGQKLRESKYTGEELPNEVLLVHTEQQELPNLKQFDIRYWMSLTKY